MAVLSDSVMPLAADWVETQLPCSPTSLAGSNVAAATLADLHTFEAQAAAERREAEPQVPADLGEKGDGAESEAAKKAACFKSVEVCCQDPPGHGEAPAMENEHKEWGWTRLKVELRFPPKTLLHFKPRTRKPALCNIMQI